MLNRTVRRYSSQASRERAVFVEQARQGVPINAYMRLLHVAAMTGELPHYDPDTGKPTGTSDQLDAQARISIAEYLLDLAVPKLKSVAPPSDEGMPSANEVSKLAPSDLQALSTDALRALIAANVTTPQPD